MQPSKITFVALMLAAVPATASAEYRYLCTSIPGSCQYTGPDAPKLTIDVCYIAEVGEARVKGASDCPTGSWPYEIAYGEIIDPLLGTVLPYAPLDDACEAGHCVENVLHDAGQEYPMCCENGGPCWPGGTCGGALYWCNDGVCNEDGTITCFDAEEL
jgi:hypothetical protein